MNKLRRFYNQNRKKIWRIIIIIAFALLLLRLLNYMAKMKNERLMQNMATEQNAINSNEQNTTAGSNSSQSSSSNSGGARSNAQKAEVDAIKEFALYCNKKDFESAYNMLTDDCKNQLFSDIQTFEKNYYNSAFENKTKEVVVNNWSNHTYLVYLKESALATGKATNENQKGDYITVVKDDDDNYKLNINSYVGYKEINKTKEDNGIKMNVVCKNTYMNYEEYKILVTNNSEEKVILDRVNDAENVYLEDENKVHYPFYSHELSENLLTIMKGHTRELNIKFYNSYNSSRKIKALVFSKLWKGNEIINFKVEL